jgi:hypothetical protein
MSRSTRTTTNGDLCIIEWDDQSKGNYFVSVTITPKEGVFEFVGRKSYSRQGKVMDDIAYAISICESEHSGFDVLCQLNRFLFFGKNSETCYCMKGEGRNV